MPPISSLTIVNDTFLQTSSLSRDILISEGDAKEQGRKLPKVFRDLRSFKRPYSGRMGLVFYFIKVVNNRQSYRDRLKNLRNGPGPQQPQAKSHLHGSLIYTDQDFNYKKV